MQIGRPSKHSRTAFGERLVAARSTLGLTQAQVAKVLGITQTTYADWERYHVALRPEQVQKLTEVLKVSVDELYGGSEGRKRGGPVGKASRIFEEVSKLPRKQQERIVGIVEDLLSAQRSSASR